MNSEELENLFLKAIELPAGSAQDRFVEESTAGNPILLKELKQLLFYHSDSGDFLETPLLQRDPSLAADSDFGAEYISQTANLEEAELDGLLGPGLESAPLGQLGHFQLLEILGRGGSAIVYRARDKKLGRDVAIKLLVPSRMQGGVSRGHFIREAQSIAALRHPSVVSIYEVGEQQGVPFIVMEYLPTGSLQSRIDSKQRIQLSESLLIAEQVTAALEAAHAAGIQHRDVKPSNILIDQWPNSIKLGDFGLATGPGQSIPASRGGTPQYASPEQLRGEELDERTDLFGLGCTIYAMLCGHSPFASGSRLQMINLTLNSEPSSLASQGVTVPPRFERLIFRLLEKDRFSRPASAREVAAELSAIKQAESRLSRRAMLSTGIGTAALFSLVGYRLLGNPAYSQRALQSGKRYYFYLSDDQLKFHLHDSQRAVCVFSEGQPGPGSKPVSYWRPAEPGCWGSVTYRFEFAQPIAICRLFASCYCSFGLDPAAKFRLSFSSDGDHWATAVVLEKEKSEQYFHSDEPVVRLLPIHEKETVVTQELFTIYSSDSKQPLRTATQLEWPDSGKARQLYLRGEFYAERELFADDGSPLGPAASQFLRYRPEYQNGPLFIDCDAAGS